MIQDTTYEHIVIDESGVPQIKGTNIKVIELALETRIHGLSLDELRLQHPNLTLGQIHSALAYYWDHKEVLDRDIEPPQERTDNSHRGALRAP